MRPAAGGASVKRLRELKSDERAARRWRWKNAGFCRSPRGEEAAETSIPTARSSTPPSRPTRGPPQRTRRGRPQRDERRLHGPVRDVVARFEGGVAVATASETVAARRRDPACGLRSLVPPSPTTSQRRRSRSRPGVGRGVPRRVHQGERLPMNASSAARPTARSFRHGDARGRGGVRDARSRRPAPRSGAAWSEKQRRSPSFPIRIHRRSRSFTGPPAPLDERRAGAAVTAVGLPPARRRTVRTSRDAASVLLQARRQRERAGSAMDVAIRRNRETREVRVGAPSNGRRRGRSRGPVPGHVAPRRGRRSERPARRLRDRDVEDRRSRHERVAPAAAHTPAVSDADAAVDLEPVAVPVRRISASAARPSRRHSPETAAN